MVSRPQWSKYNRRLSQEAYRCILSQVRAPEWEGIMYRTARWDA